jgi:hypothetical protein
MDMIITSGVSIRLDDEDSAAVAALPKDQRYVTPPFAPDWNARRSELVRTHSTFRRYTCTQ